jgi:hypothetical protein
MALAVGVIMRALMMLAIDKRAMTGLAGIASKAQCYFIDPQASFSLPAGLDVRKNSARLLNSRRDGQAQHRSIHDAAAVVISHMSAEISLLSPAGSGVVTNANHGPSFFEKDAALMSPR